MSDLFSVLSPISDTMPNSCAQAKQNTGCIHPLDAYKSSFGVQDGHWETSRECSDPESGKGSSASRTGRLGHLTARSSYEC